MEQDNKFVRSLIENTQRGNSTAFEQLYGIYSGKAYGVCLRLSANQKVAEEITIKAFREAWENVSFVRTDTPFAGWITGITIHTFLQYVLTNNEKDIPFKVTYPNDYQFTRMEQNILKLPPKQRYLVVFHLIEKYSLEESSDFLGLSYTDTRSLLEMVIADLLASLDNVYTRDQLLDKIESLPDRIQPPASIWEEIEKSIREEKTLILEEKEKLKAEEDANEAALAEAVEAAEAKKQKKEKRKNKKRLHELNSKTVFEKIQHKNFYAVILLIIIFAAVYYFFLYDNIYWALTGSTNTVLVNGKAAETGGRIAEGDILSSGDATNYSIACDAIGRVQASDGTSVKCINDTCLSFITGTFRIYKNNTAKLFTAEVPSAVVKDAAPGGYYELIINAGTNSLLKNIGGSVIVVSMDKEFYLPPGYECLIDEKAGASIPYSAAATEHVRYLLTDTTLTEDERADRIVPMAQGMDMISIWNMIKIVSPMKRGELFDYFSDRVQIPASINKDGIVYLSESMMNELRKLLEQ